MTETDRRSFLRSAARLGGASIIAPSLVGLVACSDKGATDPLLSGSASLDVAPLGAGGYGPLVPHATYPEISLPAGFDAVRLDRTGDLLDDGTVLQNAFDGMGAFAVPGRRNQVRLVRNHEMRDAAGRYAPLSPVNAYDPLANAGNTTMVVEIAADGRARLERHFVSLSGTSVNCAGGITPWGSWITCEETVNSPANGYAQNHGYCFEIPSAANGPVTPVPLKEMGRFVHEAISIDPTTGIVYLTEDAGSSGFYRFIPNVPGELWKGGILQMLRLTDIANFDTRTGQKVGRRFACDWVTIDQPYDESPTMPSTFVYSQGAAKGGAIFARLEGSWWGDSSVYFTATSGGDAGAGQVWRYVPGPRGGWLTLVFESPSFAVLNSPDNILVSPRGGIVLCEDGSGTNYVRGLTRHGSVFDLVRNNINSSEWAGACFSPQGRTLFVNMQGSTSAASTTWGATYAIWGPWEQREL
jgi:secreted PhoX family phosphatase